MEDLPTVLGGISILLIAAYAIWSWGFARVGRLMASEDEEEPRQD